MEKNLIKEWVKLSGTLKITKTWNKDGVIFYRNFLGATRIAELTEGKPLHYKIYTLQGKQKRTIPHKTLHSLFEKGLYEHSSYEEAKKNYEKTQSESKIKI